MTSFTQSKDRYESWLRQQLGAEFLANNLDEKNRLLKDSVFAFLRGTYWRWAEVIFEICPDLASSPSVLAVGDIHLENFGTWRDVDGRLVWGVNDFDEAAMMPNVLDIVRLATSAVLGAKDSKGVLASASDAILTGYGQGLEAPNPIVLERDWQWLRADVVVPENKRQKFWNKIEARKLEVAPPRFHKALDAAMPAVDLAFDTSRRIAGTGSLARPRWLGVADWRGGLVVREAKALLTSAWALARGEPLSPIRSGEIALGIYRAPDPWYRTADKIVVRRLSPNNRKIEADKGGAFVIAPAMYEVMGRELANIHLGTADARDAIQRDLTARKSGWLAAATMKAAEFTSAEYTSFKAN